MVRTLVPEPAVPDRVELLGPENIGVAVPRAPSWRSLVESLAPAMRELTQGERPKDWTDRGSDSVADPEQQELQSTAGAAEHGENEPAVVRADRYKVSRSGRERRASRAIVSCAISTRAVARRQQGSKNRTQTPRQRVQRGQRGGPSRSGAAPVRREVWDRDGGRCTYVDDSGQRCRETRFLELHHELARALDGKADTSNLTNPGAAQIRSTRSTFTAGQEV